MNSNKIERDVGRSVWDSMYNSVEDYVMGSVMYDSVWNSVYGYVNDTKVSLDDSINDFLNRYEY